MINWLSIQGHNSHSNNDYCYIHSSKTLMMLIVIDVIAIGRHSVINNESFCRKFAIEVFDEVSRQLNTGSIDIPGYTRNVRENTLNTGLLSTFKCCYSLCIFDRTSNLAHLLSLGDCLVTIKKKSSNIRVRIFEPHHLSDSPDHVYKYFSVRKFHEPDYTIMSLDFEKLFIETDGHWLFNHTDDASCLEFDIEKFNLQIQSPTKYSTSNIFYI